MNINKYEKFMLGNVFVTLTDKEPNKKLKSCNEINDLTEELKAIDIDSLDDNNSKFDDNFINFQ